MSETIFRQWLGDTVEVPLEKYSTPVKMTRADHIAFLVICNRGFVVHGWGCIGYGGGPFRQGLEMEEAWHLQYYNGVLDGFALLVPGYKEILFPMIDAYAEQKKKEFDEWEAKETRQPITGQSGPVKKGSGNPPENDEKAVQESSPSKD